MSLPPFLQNLKDTLSGSKALPPSAPPPKYEPDFIITKVDTPAWQNNTDQYVVVTGYLISDFIGVTPPQQLLLAFVTNPDGHAFDSHIVQVFTSAGAVEPKQKKFLVPPKWTFTLAINNGEKAQFSIVYCRDFDAAMELFR